MYDLNGKVALVTGAGGENGIGRAVARRLAADGANLVVNDVAEVPYPTNGQWRGLVSVTEEIEDMGNHAIHIVADVSNAEQVQNMVNQAVDALGRLDILVCNAAAIAGQDRVPLVELAESDWDRVQQINVKGVFLCCQAVARHLITQGEGGKIINISSIQGKRGSALSGAYCASKSAVISLTESLAKELASEGINVNAICPGLVDTERASHLAEAYINEEISEREKRQIFVDRITATVPLGRIASGEDVAKMAAFLASAEADYLTGLSVRVDGGKL